MFFKPTVPRYVLLSLLIFVRLPAWAGSSGIVDIEVDARPSPVTVPTPQPAPSEQVAQAGTVTRVWTVAPSSSPVASVVPMDIPTHVVVHGVFKMKDLYQSGVRAYQEKDYEKAIRYFKAALEIHDPYTSKFYYAETHGLLGVIYQYFYPVPNHLEWAKAEYEAALQIDPQTKSARKHLAEVSGKGR